jgi:hypothetical protein
MADDLRSRKQLCARIKARRADIDEFLAHARPRRNVLNNVSIVCSALAAVLTAPPALGGTKAMKAIADGLSLAGPPQAWQPLCIGAFVVAVAAAIAANLHRSYDLPAQVAAAEACNSELESLLALLDFDDLPVHNAVEQYQQSIHKIPFVKEQHPAPVAARH